MNAVRGKVRLLYQMTTAKQNTDLGQAEVDRRLAYARSLVGPDTEVDFAVPKEGPGSIETRADAAAAVPALIDAVRRAEANGYDAVIISCFSDPGLDACREMVSIPVTASAQASMHVAAQLGSRFSVISPGSRRSSRGYDNPRKYGLWERFASVRLSGLSVMDLARDRERTLERLAEVGRLAVDEDGADTLVLGCMSMAFHGIDRELAARVGVPVVNPVPASLMLAELLVRCGLRQSPLAYPLSAPPNILRPVA
jgi:allantoin racemase